MDKNKIDVVRIAFIVDIVKLAGSVHAFVLLGLFVFLKPRQQKLNVVTKDKNIFCR